MHPWHFGKGPHEGRGHWGRRGFLGRFGNEGMGGGGRGGFRAARVLSSDDLQLIILHLLKEKARHGYEIIKALEERSSGVYAPSPGVIYPALTFLEETNYATSETEGNKKLFKLTAVGLEHLDKNQSLVDETLAQLELYGKKMAQAQAHMADEENEESDNRWESRMGSRQDWRQTKMEFRALKEELKAAIFEKFGASPEERKRIVEVLRKAIAEIRGK